MSEPGLRRAFVLTAALLASAPAARAQSATPTPRSPEETAKSIAARWKPLLGLSDDQTARFEAVALTAEKKTAEAKAAAGGDSAKFQESMAAIFKERKAAVEKILTPPQWQQYEAYMAKARKAIGKPVPAPTKAPA
jgi:hypothetical protein